MDYKPIKEKTPEGEHEETGFFKQYWPTIAVSAGTTILVRLLLELLRLKL